MVMADETELRNFRTAAVQAAATFLTGTRSDDIALIGLADLISEYIVNGSPAAYAMLGAAQRTAEPDGASASSGAENNTAPDGGGPARMSLAQELANQGYAATDRVRVAEIISKAEAEGELSSVVRIGNNTGYLHDYLNMLLRTLPAVAPAETKVPPPGSEELRNELGL